MCDREDVGEAGGEGECKDWQRQVDGRAMKGMGMTTSDCAYKLMLGPGDLDCSKSWCGDVLSLHTTIPACGWSWTGTHTCVALPDRTISTCQCARWLLTLII